MTPLDTNANRVAHEVAQAAEISRLRSALARIEGASGHAASATTNELDRGSFRLIEAEARNALDGEQP